MFYKIASVCPYRIKKCNFCFCIFYATSIQFLVVWLFLCNLLYADSEIKPKRTYSGKSKTYCLERLRIFQKTTKKGKIQLCYLVYYLLFCRYEHPQNATARTLSTKHDVSTEPSIFSIKEKREMNQKVS